MPKVKTVSTKDAPQAVGPYSQAVKAADFVFLSGQIHIDPETGKLIEGDIQEKTHRIFKNIIAVAKASEAELADVVKMTVFLKDMSDFAKVNEVYSQYFTQNLPARSAVQVAGLPLNADIEIEAVIYKKQN